VRGTTFRVEVDAEQGDSVSVTTASEVQREGRRMRLKQRMMMRMMQGNLGEGRQFDPDKIERWRNGPTSRSQSVS